MTLDKAFPGRVIFDHLPKTAGTAINSWLTEELGTGCVTPGVIGYHRDLIRQYGALYSVISGHVHFKAGEGLDPRYQYITCFREPIERVVSWLFFVINNYEDSNLPELRPAVRRFLESDGFDFPEILVDPVSNLYVEHFCRINGSGLESDDQRIANALAAIKEYDIVGMLDEMPRFLAEVATMIGLPPPPEIAHVNVTAKRPQVDQMSLMLRERIRLLNQLDLRLYAEVAAWKASARHGNAGRVKPLSASKWKKFDPAVERIVITRDAAILSAVLREGAEIRHGQLMNFDVDFFLAKDVQALEMGIHIFDSDRQWAFGINSTLLGQSHNSLCSGRYRVSHHLVANLPAGKYTAGFAFHECLPDGLQHELAWRDVLCEFNIIHEVKKPFVGYSYLPAEISLFTTPIPSKHTFSGGNDRLSTMVGVRVGDTIASTGKAGWLSFGPYIPLLAGEYQVSIHGTLGESGFAGAYMDVVANGGNSSIAEHVLEDSDEDGCFIVLPVFLTASYSDVEVRVWVTESSDVQISLIEIRRRSAGARK